MERWQQEHHRLSEVLEVDRPRYMTFPPQTSRGMYCTIGYCGSKSVEGTGWSEEESKRSAVEQMNELLGHDGTKVPA